LRRGDVGEFTKGRNAPFHPVSLKRKNADRDRYKVAVQVKKGGRGLYQKRKRERFWKCPAT